MFNHRENIKETIDRLRSFDFFKEFETSTLKEIAQNSTSVTIKGGDALFEQGTKSDGFFICLSGRLIVVREIGGREETIGYVRSGDPLGEMSLLAGDNHSASVFALRDTQLLLMPKEAFEDLFEDHADFASSLARSIMRRTRRPEASGHQTAPRVFALVATSPSFDLLSCARSLVEMISRLGRSVRLLTEEDGPIDANQFDQFENAHDVTLLVCRIEDTEWYRFALRHADRFFVFARQDARPPVPLPLSPSNESPARRFRLVDLVIAREGQKVDLAASLSRWVEATDANRIFYWGTQDEQKRLARAITGNTIGLVLSGGGARAYAHIGAVRAMREKNVPIDFVCGASMGAVIGACVAMGWRDEEIVERIRDAFVESNPLGDHVLPVVALTKGELVEERLKKHFGDVLIEELAVSYFCISSELTSGHEYVHRRGRLRDALRASISLPGILPPVVQGEDLLVDGAVMNNFPTERMRGLHRGLTIGVDVARRGTISAEAYVDPPSFVSWIRKYGIRTAPPIVPLLMRSATARRESEDINHAADITITPSVSGVELRDWKRFDQAVEDGYRETLAALEAHWPQIKAIIDPEPDAVTNRDPQNRS